MQVIQLSKTLGPWGRKDSASQGKRDLLVLRIARRSMRHPSRILAEKIRVKELSRFIHLGVQILPVHSQDAVAQLDKISPEQGA